MNKAVIGVDLDSNKDVLGKWIGENELVYEPRTRFCTSHKM